MAYITDINAIPIMTSNTSPSGIASASGELLKTSQYAYKAFAKSVVNDNAWAVESAYGWLQYKFDEAKVITKYVLKNELDPIFFMSSSPKDFQLLGSLNGTDWEVLDEQTGVSDWLSNGTTKTYEFENRKGYVYYRLNILSNNGSIYTSVGELELYELIFESRVVIKNPTTNQHYSLAERTLIPLPNTSDKNMILHGIEAGKEIQLDEAFDKIHYVSDTPVVDVTDNSKVFTQRLEVRPNKIWIKEVK